MQNNFASRLNGYALPRRTKAATALITAALVAGAPAAAAILSTGSAAPQLAAAATNAERIVNAVPAGFTPQIVDGRVFSITQVGDQMIVGGTFTKVSKDGVTFARTNVVAFDATTGAINTRFHPALNGSVEALQPGPRAGTVYVGGTFAGKLKLLNVPDGSPATGFTVPTIALGNVTDIDVVGGRLFFGGSFRKVGGKPHVGLATLDAATGALDPYASLNFTGHHNWTEGSTGAKAPEQIGEFAVSPYGTTMLPRFGIDATQQCGGLAGSGCVRRPVT